MSTSILLKNIPSGACGAPSFVGLHEGIKL